MPKGFKQAFLKRVREQGGWTPLLDRYSEGESLGTIAPDYGVSRVFLYTYLKSPRRPKLYESFMDARAARAEKMADEAQDIADNVNATRDDVAKAKLRIEQRRWRAALLDREMFDIQPKQQQQPVLNIGEAFVQILRERPTTPPARQLKSGTDALPVQDAQIEPETPTPNVQ